MESKRKTCSLFCANRLLLFLSMEKNIGLRCLKWFAFCRLLFVAMKVSESSKIIKSLWTQNPKDQLLLYILESCHFMKIHDTKVTNIYIYNKLQTICFLKALSKPTTILTEQNSSNDILPSPSVSACIMVLSTICCS